MSNVRQMPVKLSHKPIVPQIKWASINNRQLKKTYSFLTMEDVCSFMQWVSAWEDSRNRFSIICVDTKTRKVDVVLGGDLIGLTELDIEQAKEYDDIYKQVTYITVK